MAEELTQALTALAERGDPRGAASVLDSARRDASVDPPAWWVARPAWVAAAAFVSTMVVLGGALGLGLLLRQPPSDVGAGWLAEALDETTASSTTEWFLIPAIAIVVALAALIVRRHLVTIRKERTMAKTIDSPSIEDLNQQQQKTLETTRRNNHWLTGAVIVLAIALVALGTWAVLDSSSEPATAATDEIQALYDDYIAAWSEIDADAFLATTTEDYVQYSFGIAMSQSSRAAVIRTTPSLDVELVGELVVMADGTNYYVAAAERVTILEQEYQGVSAYRVVPTPDGLRISEHTWVGNL